MFFFFLQRKEKFFEESEKGIDIKTAMKSKFFQDFKIKDTEETKESKEFINSIEETRTIIWGGYGAPFDGEKGDLEFHADYIESVRKSPTPISFDLQFIYKIFTTERFPDDKDIDAKRGALRAFLKVLYFQNSERYSVLWLALGIFNF